MAKKKAAKTTGTVKKKNEDISPELEASRITFRLTGTLKRVQLMYLLVGELLVEIRDRKLHEALKFPDMATYARERLGLSKTTLYDYMRIYDWVSRNHPEWLKPKAKGFIPDLSDVGDLIWLENELARTNLTPARREILEGLQKKGLAGKLRQAEMRGVRKTGTTTQGGVKSVIATLKTVRRRAAKLANMSPEVLAHIDAAIEILGNDTAISVAKLGSWGNEQRRVA